MHTSPRNGSRICRRATAAIGAGLIGLGLLAAPTAATAAPSAATAPVGAACTVDSATLTWGVKERFRSYVSGSIANGEWTVSEDMRYETPSFIWDKVTGSVGSELDEGTLSFTGAIHFTGHGGAMKLDLADPAIEFAGDDTAYLLLTIGSTDTADAGGEAVGEQVRAAKIDLSDAVTAGGGELEIAGAVPRLTAEGAAAFNGDYGSYVSGEDLDPITLTAAVSGCELGESVAATPEPTTPETTAQPGTPTPEQEAPAAAPGIPWVPIAIGGVALLVIGVTGGMLLAGRNKTQAADAARDDEPQSE
ncbi:HtaA domain-containing protein [Leucobacter chromiireducens]|uniref:HtaA domain-containing protein n=1 Tax=Leucobacter chromiireducens TaxID=283877 RepID=UPI001F156A89|nr:HtaA domain-containing protein [Leucobacter chromiireducens]